MITTHVLDTAKGTPAIDMAVVLEVHEGSEWMRISHGRTDDRGRLESLTVVVPAGPGVYRLTFDTGTYFRDVMSFFPTVQVTFKVRSATEHVHVPLLVSPFGYSTYKGA